MSIRRDWGFAGDFVRAMWLMMFQEEPEDLVIGTGEAHSLEDRFAFVRACGDAFLDAYLPIAERRLDARTTESDRTWQLLRRGRYVEFNLVYDRGTTFGLKTRGRAESILMSLPPVVLFPYAPEPPDDRARALLDVLRHPRAWV